jgi:hypothetical protein
MAKEKLSLLTLRSLADLGDGDLEKDFEEVLKTLVRDCTTRPSIKKSREVKLVVTLAPALNQDGTCDDVMVDVFASRAAAATFWCPDREPLA